MSAAITAAIGGAIAGGLYALANGQDILQGAVNGALIAGAAAFTATATAYLQNAIMSWAGEMLGGLRTAFEDFGKSLQFRGPPTNFQTPTTNNSQSKSITLGSISMKGINIYGGTYLEQQSIYSDLDKIFKTKRGKDMRNKMKLQNMCNAPHLSS